MSRITKIVWVLGFSTMWLANVNGQTNYLPDIVPPSPEASSLGKFVEIPVSHYTGIPKINVPIFEINFDGLTIPINLSYHARGIKVEEIASRIGIGWALNAGGVITRQIREKNDFSPDGYFYGNYYKNFELIPAVRDSLFGTAAKLEGDFVPDQFIFNFLEYSGKFIFDQKTKEPVLQNYDDLKIERIGYFDGNLHFIITTKEGFKFYFGHPEVPNTLRNAKSKEILLPHVLTTSVSVSSTSIEYTSTWHLIDIVSPNGKKIHFHYEKENPSFYRRSYDKLENGGLPSSFFSKIQGIQYHLKEIIFDSGKVKFIKSAKEREDLNGGFALSSIEVENNYKRIRKYNFYYSYSYNNSPNNINHYLFNEIQAKKRLFLDSIQELGNANNTRLYRSFEYNNKSALPNRFSNEQDVWGYYNGKDNGVFLTIFGYGSQTVNREVDTVKAGVGLIKKVNYPTGGFSSYTFEANKAIVPDYFKDLLFANPNPTIIGRYASLKKGLLNQIADKLYENDFTILPSDIGPITVNVHFYGNVGTCSSTENTPFCKYRVSIVDDSGQTVINNGIPLYLFSGPSYKIPIEILPAGNYKLRVEVVNGTDDPNAYEDGFTVYLSWYQPEQSNTPPDLMYSGGNRIKKIENYSADEGKITKTYKYIKPDGSCSGLIYALPSYYYSYRWKMSNGVEVPVLDAYGARSGSPLSYEQGNHVGYSHVTEYYDAENSQGKGGKIAYEFTAMPDGGKFYEFPYTLAVNNEWLRGKPLLVEYYKKGLNGFNIKKTEEFIYKYADEFSYGVLSDPYNLKLTPDQTIPKLNYVHNSLKFYRPLIKFKADFVSSNFGVNLIDVKSIGPDNYKVYYLTGGVQNLFKKIVKNYNTNGTLSLTTDYNYDYNNHYQLASSEKTDSKGDIFKTIIDYGILYNPRRVLPKNTQTYNGSTKLSEHNRSYNTFQSLYLLAKVQTSKGNNPLETVLTYHRYDSIANPLEVSQKDGMHTVYLYGYTKQYPIAKIENATFAEVATALGVSEDALEGYNENHLDSINALRAQKPEWMITTYTHIPLVGVKTITDPKGMIMTYEYDSFNRLKHIKDPNGDILEAYDYHYKTE